MPQSAPQHLTLSWAAGVTRVANIRASSSDGQGRAIVFGCGFSGRALCNTLERAGWNVTGVTRSPDAQTSRKTDLVNFADRRATQEAIKLATHIVSTVPPSDATDPVLDVYEDDIRRAEWLVFIGYLSSTVVYRASSGDLVDEKAPLAKSQRAQNRLNVEQQWSRLGSTVFRLSGLYGPGRSALSSSSKRLAKALDDPSVVSRVHVDDVVRWISSAMEQKIRNEVFNLSDDVPEQRKIVYEYAEKLVSKRTTSSRSEMFGWRDETRATSKRINNSKAKDTLGSPLLFPSYLEGLTSIARMG